VVDRLAANGIDLAGQPIEVAPIAHYHMGGIRVDETLESRIRGLFACGEAIGGANGANRLSGNAITETFVFGARAGRYAAQRARQRQMPSADITGPAIDFLRSAEQRDAPNTAAMIASLQSLMSENVGPFRTDDKLRLAIERLEDFQRDLGDRPLASSSGGFDPVLVDWLDLRNMLLVARAVALPALARNESRGAHQREDYSGLDDSWRANQVVEMIQDRLNIGRANEMAPA
jgi:succinate dehydrogenase/fumarate reductase flavoprotein subunit